MVLQPRFNELEEKVMRTEVGYCLITADAFDITGRTAEGKRVVRIVSMGKATIDCDELTLKVNRLTMEITLKEKTDG